MKKRVALIASISIVIISIVISSLLIINQLKSNNKLSSKEYSNKLSNYNKSISEINSNKNKEFRENGLTAKYYDLQDELTEVEKEKSKLIMNNRREDTSFIFKIFPSIFIIIFGCTFSAIIYKFIIFNQEDILNNLEINKYQEINNNNEEKEYVAYKCPNCGNTNLKGNIEEKCEYCGSLLQKVKKSK